MLRRIISAVGLGLLGIDPFTAFYILTLGLRKEKQMNISLFMGTFAAVSILPAAMLSVTFGSVAADYLQRVIPEDNSPIWAALELAVSIAMAAWVIRKKFVKGGKEKRNKEESCAGAGSALKCITTGALFAIAAFTDPTYYAVMLLGGETRSFFASLLYLSIWLLVSQSPAFVAYFASQFHLLHKLTDAIDRMQRGRLGEVKHAFYAVMAVVALTLFVDSGAYLFMGEYLF